MQDLLHSLKCLQDSYPIHLKLEISHPEIKQL